MDAAKDTPTCVRRSQLQNNLNPRMLVLDCITAKLVYYQVLSFDAKISLFCCCYKWSWKQLLDVISGIWYVYYYYHHHHHLLLAAAWFVARDAVWPVGVYECLRLCTSDQQYPLTQQQLSHPRHYTGTFWQYIVYQAKYSIWTSVYYDKMCH